MKTVNALKILILTLMLTGCYTTNRFQDLMIEIVQPAKIRSSPESRIAATIYKNSNYLPDSLTLGYILNKKVLYDTINYDSIASLKYYDNFVKSLNDLKYYDTIIDMGKYYPELSAKNIEVLSKSESDSILNTINADILYSLDYYGISDIVVEAYWNEWELWVFIDAFWTVYDINLHDKGKTFMKSDTVKFNYVYNDNVIQEIQKERSELMNEASLDVGSLIASYMVPHWKEVERLFYLSGNTQMLLAKKYAEQNEWLKAAEIWRENSKNKNKNIAAKSMFNLALACEMEGKIDAAIDWIVKSLLIYEQKNEFHTTICMDYVRILSQRRIDMKVLKEQIISN